RYVIHVLCPILSQSCVNDRFLLSFPTRRSSDLTPVLAVTDGTVVRKHWNALGGNTLYLRSADGRYDFYYAHLDSYALGIEIGRRSEEHTSELQSRENLVCRLLLEKKNHIELLQ